jgi:hypothetical protein
MVQGVEYQPSKYEALSSNSSTAGSQWFTPVILATQEAEIRKIYEPYLKKKKKKSHKKGWWSGSKCRP